MQGIDLSLQILRTDLAHVGWAFACAKSVNLSGAHLIRANLSGANLSDADLSGAIFSYDIFGTVDDLTRAQLRSARNVDWDKVPDDLPDD